MLVNRGNYPEARHYIGHLLRTVYGHLTIQQNQCNENEHHNNILLSKMESELSLVISLIGQRRFGSVFDISINMDVNLKGTREQNQPLAPKPLSLKEKVELLQPHGCYTIFRSKTHAAVRAFPVHGDSGNCDLKSLYQVMNYYQYNQCCKYKMV